MKVALGFFGLSRTYEKCLRETLKYFEGHNFDIYILTWKENKENLLVNLTEICGENLKKIIFFEELQNFEEIQKINEEYLLARGPLDGIYGKSRGYIYQTLGRREVGKLIFESGIEYEAIFTLRLDVILQGKFQSNVVMRDDTLYGGMDLIFYGNQKVMKEFLKFDPPFYTSEVIFGDVETLQTRLSWHFKPEIQYTTRIRMLNLRFDPNIISTIIRE